MEHSLEATSFSRPNKERWLGDHDINTFKQEIKSSRRIKKIGEGTYGAVFKTESPTGMNVALKKINLENEHEGFPITALREIKMLKAIRHPNIISLLDVIPVHTGGRRPDFHLIFEYLDHDLAGLMASGEVVLQEQHVKHCLYELLRGLEYLHNRCKLIHRDVKLSNILVGKDGSIKIADFGLARQHYSDKRDYTGRVVTLWYRAPELLLGIKNYSTAIDIWAAGCVFSEIVFGKPAFPGETEIQQLTLICKVVGAPNKENFSDFEKLPIKVSKDYPRTFDQRYAKFKKKSPEGFKLLSRMLEIDPHKRITATEALSHSYFLQKPYPDKPKLSDILPSHDYESRMRRQNIKKRKLNN